LALARIPKKNEEKNKNKFEFGYDNLCFCSIKYNKKAVTKEELSLCNCFFIVRKVI
jgi:hypothetical protein